MSESAAFLLYAGVFRLAVVAVGALAIWLGYRLFSAMTTPAGSAGGTDAEARIGEVQLTLRGAAPGTCFAVFGAAIVAVMLAKGMPEFSQRESAGADSEQALVIKGTPGVDTISSTAFAQSLARGDELLRAGDNGAAASAYARALTDPRVPLGEAARAFNQLAWLEHLAGNDAAAAALARVAVGLDPGNGDYLDTLARAETAKRGALEAARRAGRTEDDEP